MVHRIKCKSSWYRIFCTIHLKLNKLKLFKRKIRKQFAQNKSSNKTKRFDDRKNNKIKTTSVGVDLSTPTSLFIQNMANLNLNYSINMLVELLVFFLVFDISHTANHRFQQTSKRINWFDNVTCISNSASAEKKTAE